MDCCARDSIVCASVPVRRGAPGPDMTRRVRTTLYPRGWVSARGLGPTPKRGRESAREEEEEEEEEGWYELGGLLQLGVANDGPARRSFRARLTGTRRRERMSTGGQPVDAVV